MSRPTPLQEATRQAGAAFGNYADWALPEHYGDPKAEYQAALGGAAIVDYSHAAKLELNGPDAPAFLSNLSTNDIRNLPLGGGCEAYFCDSRAKVQFQAWIYHVLRGDGRPAMIVETTPGRNAELLRYLDRYLISEQVELADQTESLAQLHLAGPEAKAVLERAFSQVLPDLSEFQHLEMPLESNTTASIRRHDPLGLPGYDLVCPNGHAVGLWQKLTASGARPAGLMTHETLRVEAGTPVFGPDIDANRFVMEVGNAARAVCYTKGCYLGQEPIVMARDRAGHVNRAFLGVKVLEGGLLPHGTKLLRDGQEVGQVTSSVDSPRLGRPVALAYLRWKHQEPGLRLEAETPAGKQAVEVVGLPPVK